MHVSVRTINSSSYSKDQKYETKNNLVKTTTSETKTEGVWMIVKLLNVTHSDPL